jgi:hypothetical protein
MIELRWAIIPHHGTNHGISLLLWERYVNDKTADF